MTLLKSIVEALDTFNGIHDMTAKVGKWEISIWMYDGTWNIKFEKKIQPEEEHEDE